MKSLPSNSVVPFPPQFAVPSDEPRVVGFVFEGREIHAFEYQGEPHFVASEVASVLGYTNPQEATREHCKALKSLKQRELLSLGITCGPRGLNIIPERDLYRLVMRSKLPQAQAFEEKVVGEILPAIRRTGGYIAAAPTETPEQIMAKAVLVAQDTIQRQQTQIEVLEPKAVAFDATMRDDGLVRLSEFARSFPGVNLNAFGQSLAKEGFLYRYPNTLNQWKVRRSHKTERMFVERLTRNVVNGTERIINRIFVTGYGAQEISRLYADGKLTLRNGYTPDVI